MDTLKKDKVDKKIFKLKDGIHESNQWVRSRVKASLYMRK